VLPWIASSPLRLLENILSQNIGHTPFFNYARAAFENAVAVVAGGARP